MLTCKGCIHLNDGTDCKRDGKRCDLYSRKNKAVANPDDIVIVKEKNETRKAFVDDGYRCKQNCPDHTGYWCPKDEICMCPGMCRGRIAAGRCSGCDTFDRATMKEVA